MKVLFASDIHGSAYFCRKLLEVFEQSRADKLILLGDLLYHGPRNDLPAEYDTRAVTVMLNSVKDRILAVRGNCDSEVDQMVLEFPMMADYAWLMQNGIRFFTTHGHLYNDAEAGKFPLLSDGDVLIHGHIHLPVAEKKPLPCETGSYFLLNPGSVSLPKGGNPPSYALLEERTFQIFDFDGRVLKRAEL